jgi:hypothetical protein
MSYQLHIVSHCYAEKLKCYAAFLKYQLSSLVLHPPKVRTLIEICFTDTDRSTMDVLDWFAANTRVHLELRNMNPPGRLFRRSIGRNEAALSGHAELLWFADVDHVFGPGCIDGLWQAWESLTDFRSLIWPRELLIHKTHEIGDRYAEREGYLLDVDPADFEPKRCRHAIGGIQIVPGSLCRRIGYLDGHRRFQTTKSAIGRFRDDVAFRMELQKLGPFQVVKFPNLFRLRHSVNGRDIPIKDNDI